MICGHTEWCGSDPTVVHLTDSGTRKVQVSLHEVRGKHRFTMAVVLDDPDALIRELELARIWVKEG